MIVAIDGPAGSGKSSVARAIANSNEFLYLNTGAMYRGMAVCARKHNLDVTNEAQMQNLCSYANLSYDIDNGQERVFVENKDVTNHLREPDIDQLASDIAKSEAVRTYLNQIQQRLSETRDVIAEGRDTTTVVFPNAEIKIYLDASLSARAERRAKDHSNSDIETEMQALKLRDNQDATRALSPLVCPVDAVYIDSSAYTLDGVITLVKNLIKERKNGRRDNS